MERKWKPGDVARWQYLSEPQIALRVRRCANEHHVPEEHWHLSDGGWTAGDEVTIHPLLAIDPESIEDVERIQNACWRGGTLEHWQAALRSLITPPKPDEPLGLGAVVEDADGRRHVRTVNGWVGSTMLMSDWSKITTVRVLSEGVVTE